FHAWDQSAGTNGGTMDATSTGDPSSLSVNVDTATLTVNHVNHAPGLTTPPNATMPSVVQNVSPAANPGTDVHSLVQQLTISAVDPGDAKGVAVPQVDTTTGFWQYSVDGGTTWLSFGTNPTSSSPAITATVVTFPGAAVLLADSATDRVRFLPNVG